jgi:hypothetical protein
VSARRTLSATGSAGPFTRGADASGSWYHLSTARFVSTYAMTTPYEDFAETFEWFFRNRAGESLAIPPTRASSSQAC